MKYQEILDRLRMERKANDEALGKLVADVKEFFGGDLQNHNAGDAFTYKKNNEVFVVERNRDIVGRWTKLLESSAAIREQWDHFQLSRS